MDTPRPKDEGQRRRGLGCGHTGVLAGLGRERSSDSLPAVLPRASALGGRAVPSPAVTPRSSCLWPVRLTAMHLALNPGSVPFLFLEWS